VSVDSGRVAEDTGHRQVQSASMGLTAAVQVLLRNSAALRNPTANMHTNTAFSIQHRIHLCNLLTLTTYVRTAYYI